MLEAAYLCALQGAKRIAGAARFDVNEERAPSESLMEVTLTCMSCKEACTGPEMEDVGGLRCWFVRNVPAPKTSGGYNKMLCWAWFSSRHERLSTESVSCV
jgi:hypothetical protein